MSNQRLQQQSLALLIPGSRLNARNSPSASPYCNHQPLQKISWIERDRENLTTPKFFTRIIFNVKISRSTVFAVHYTNTIVHPDFNHTITQSEYESDLLH